MDIAGARGSAARIASALRRVRTGPAMRELTAELSAAVRARPCRPSGVRDVCRALCEEMSARRGGRPVEVRFERFPDEIEVTGLWVEFQDFDLVIVEERAEAVQQLVILGHELWHLHAGHRHHHHGVGTAAADALARRSGRSGRSDEVNERSERFEGSERSERSDWDSVALAVAARSGSRADDEAEADDFGHRLAARFRRYLNDSATAAETAAVQRTLGYRGRRGSAR
ncbi:toxin-antitoxin system, toxin component family protein [Streptomyces sp. ME18-1-4]|uniref:toxin-antitoxin system, toxin component family protein n=1 Tax=Streptomyces sp. ME18-1-4 TaxID=3028685 RepID=UPI0029B3D00A|nr:toxin-antitoxin system, toxin component family protein [Streptomyces sp. ME18-1-4]MDX3247841.1 toxin-antitoxin system, toxin component family protein [Streptomyces sp. ME18-1-4]